MKMEQATKPCELPCMKCGSGDVHRRFYRKGDGTNGTSPKKKIPSSEYVNRDSKWHQPAIKECIIHTCRCCGYEWDTASGFTEQLA